MRQMEIRKASIALGIPVKMVYPFQDIANFDEVKDLGLPGKEPCT